jgi:hypothetical protein
MGFSVATAHAADDTLPPKVQAYMRLMEHLRAAEQDCYELSRIYASYNSTRKSEGFQQVGELKEDDTQHRGHFGNGWSPAD